MARARVLVAVRRTLPAALLPLLIFLETADAVAEAPVKESAPVGEVAVAQAAGARSEVERWDENRAPARLGELFHRLQVLQQEVQGLRGKVEEQAFQIERLTRQQQQQYIDIDQRLVALRGQRQGTPVTAPGRRGTPAAPAPRPAPPVSGGAPPERDAYAAAFGLMQEGRFEESVDAFNRLIADFPNGQFTPNAFYWLGELRLATDEVELARQSFAQVLSLYPEHGKVPDALYKLGVTHHRLDDNERALEYLDRVIADHPDSTAAGLARTYAEELR